jgi:ribose transport system substrate-binding protein
MGVRLGYEALNGKKPEQTVTLLPSKLVTRENANEYKGWQAVR